MPRANGLRVLLCQLDHRLISPCPADETFARRLAECQPELDSRYCAYQRFVNVFDSLDEMGLPQNEIDGFRLFDLYGLDFHELVSSNLIVQLGWIAVFR